MKQHCKNHQLERNNVRRHKTQRLSLPGKFSEWMLTVFLRQLPVSYLLLMMMK